MKITIHPYTMRFLFELKRWQAFQIADGAPMARLARIRNEGVLRRLAVRKMCNVYVSSSFHPRLRINQPSRVNKRVSRFASMRHEPSDSGKHVTEWHIWKVFFLETDPPHSYSCLFPHFTQHAWLGAHTWDIYTLAKVSLTLPYESSLGLMCSTF